eukprot:PITA_21301
MAFNGLRLKYALDGSSNYIAWKDRMEAVLEENGLKDLIDQEVHKPTIANAQELEEWKKCVARARRILLEGVRDHIVSSLHGKETPFSMWKTLKDLYQNNNDQRMLVLKDKLWKMKCEKGDTISTYMNKLTTCRDKLGSVGITTVDDDMVSLSLLSVPKSWHSYQDSVNGREKLPDLESLWSDLMQEEIRRSTKDGSSSKHDDEENLALASKARKGKGKASHSKLSSSHGGKRIDKSKVRCFNCHEVGHYATNCPLRKSKKGSSKGSDGEALASQFELDFTLIACMVSSMREHGAPLTLTDVKYVPGLKKNLVSVTMLEDKGYDVVFNKGKAFLRHIATGQTKRIRIRVKNLYKLEVDDCVALSSKAELVQSQDISELWHKQLGHLHHGALKIMQ